MKKAKKRTTKKKATKKTASRRKVAAKKKPAKKKVARKKRVKAVPAAYGSVTPYLVCKGTAGAIDFYKKAFGAKERMRMPGPDGSVMHAEIKIGSSIVMLGEEMPEMGAKSPQTLGGSPASILLYVSNVDRAFEKATAAGATTVMPVQDMFWGDRYGKLKDPFGHEWQMATHKEDLTPKQMAERVKAAMAPPPSQ